MEIKKVQWDISTERVSMHMPLMKVDTENRLVSGFASLDNEDQQNDVVEKSASVEAFTEFRGNIREMHQPIAVGRMINFVEDSFVDPKSGNEYNGIWVTVKVSKGAQDTWEKVLDGTLSGFSIGGAVLESESVVRKSDDGFKSVNVIKKYKLTELSLVDSPANQFANVFSITKADEATGMIPETKIENVFFCATDGIAKSADAESKSCNVCEKPMAIAGWIEKDSGSSVAKISDVIRKFEGGVENMPEENKEEAPVVEEVVATETVEEVPADEAKTDDAPTEETVEKTVVVEEVETSDLEVAIKSLTDKIEELTKSSGESDKSLEVLKDALSEVKTEVAGLKKGQDEINDSVGTLKKNLADIEGRFEKVDNSTAVKKSVSNETEVQKSTSSLWDGSPMSLRK